MPLAEPIPRSVLCFDNACFFSKNEITYFILFEINTFNYTDDVLQVMLKLAKIGHSTNELHKTN